LESGLKEARAGHLIGLLHFSHNFSKSFEERLDLGSEAQNGSVDASVLSVWMDMSCKSSVISQMDSSTDMSYLFTEFDSAVKSVFLYDRKNV